MPGRRSASRLNGPSSLHFTSSQLRLRRFTRKWPAANARSHHATRDIQANLFFERQRSDLFGASGLWLCCQLCACPLTLPGPKLLRTLDVHRAASQKVQQCGGTLVEGLRSRFQGRCQHRKLMNLTGAKTSARGACGQKWGCLVLSPGAGVVLGTGSRRHTTSASLEPASLRQPWRACETDGVGTTSRCRAAAG